MVAPEAMHLGDGAYVSRGSYHGEIIFTANHHDPAMATDRVIGWILGRDGKTQRWWWAGAPTPAFFVDIDALQPLDSP